MVDKLIKGFVVSSVDPEKASLSIKGLLLANVGIIVFILHYFNLPYSVEDVTNIIGILSMFVGAALTAAGLARKLWVAVFPPEPQNG